MVQKTLILLILVIFPLGQLPGAILQEVLHLPFRVHPLDILVIALFLKSRKTNNSIFWALTFSLLFSLSLFTISEILIGVLYAVRLVAYVSLFYSIPKNGQTKYSLLYIGVAIAAFGWLQYIFFPDLRLLKFLGWDDHYYRLVSTFFDPAFTGILLALTTVLALEISPILAPFTIFTLAFTYSRASYLALIVAIVYMIYKTKKLKYVISIVLLIFSILILPNRHGGEGENLTRTNSLTQKLVNYKESFLLIKKSPVFGLGYNNICTAKEKLLGLQRIPKNSCNGLDNSFLFILSTTGVVGLMFFINFLASLKGGKIFTAALFAVLVHSMFTNTLFYPWVMAWLAFTWKSRD